jgi:hypothetical protein
MYAFFKIFVELQHETGKTFIKKYNTTLIRRQILENGLLKNASIYSSKSVFLVIGAENNNLGKILSCTSNIYKIVGKASRNLMGRNITDLMPASIASVHDNFLKARLDNAEKLIQFTKFASLALHEKGYLVPVALNVTVYPSLNDGFCFWGMINQVATQFDYIILAGNGYIEGVSLGMKELLCQELPEKTLIGLVCKVYPMDETKSPTLKRNR